MRSQISVSRNFHSKLFKEFDFLWISKLQWVQTNTIPSIFIDNTRDIPTTLHGIVPTDSIMKSEARRTPALQHRLTVIPATPPSLSFFLSFSDSFHWKGSRGATIVLAASQFVSVYPALAVAAGSCIPARDILAPSHNSRENGHRRRRPSPWVGCRGQKVGCAPGLSRGRAERIICHKHAGNNWILRPRE